MFNCHEDIRMQMIRETEAFLNTNLPAPEIGAQSARIGFACPKGVEHFVQAGMVDGRAIGPALPDRRVLIFRTLRNLQSKDGPGGGASRRLPAPAAAVI